MADINSDGGKKNEWRYQPVTAEEVKARSGLPAFFAKAQSGRESRVAYFGGSITEQAGWRVKSLAWLRERYPAASFVEINAAIGGTGSEFGAFRMGRHVLRHDPDLIFVEFAVNDSGGKADDIYRSMEGIVRQARRHNPLVDICFVYTLTDSLLKDLQAGRCNPSASVMERVADHYGIPSIQLGVEVVRLLNEGKLVFKGEKPKTPEEAAALKGKILFSPDSVHPYTDTGHAVYQEIIARSLIEIEKRGTDPGARALPAPLTPGNLEWATMLPASDAITGPDWERLDMRSHPVASQFERFMPSIFRAAAPGASFTVKFKGSAIGLANIVGPDTGELIVTIDGEAPKSMCQFDEYCTWHRISNFVFKNLPDAWHTVKFEVSARRFDKAEILKRRNETMKDPRQFADFAVYAGGLLLVGKM
ncbi:MAG: SGNH/GDSL hydrolase family protein [Lentisphaerae bacterium]|nr:SGNH/GDSL hydrolase family protein [Lentisphaerota bacterium]